MRATVFWLVLLGAATAGCRGRDTATPRDEPRAPIAATGTPAATQGTSPVAPVTASEPVPAPSPAAEPELSPGPRVDPTSADDLDWIAETIAQLRTRPPSAAAIARFGQLDGKNGSYDRVRPWSAAFARVSFIEHPSPPLRTLMLEVQFAPSARPQLSRIEAKVGRSKATPRVHFDSPHKRIILLEDRKGHNLSRVVLELAPKPSEHLVHALVIDNAEGDASLWAP